MAEVRLIDANRLRDKKKNATVYTHERYGCEVIEYIDIINAPTIDPESLRPKGRKERSAISETGLMCTNCYSDVDMDAVFCKYCGAKMEG